MDLTVDNSRFTNGSENEKMFNDIDMKSEESALDSYGDEVNQLLLKISRVQNVKHPNPHQ